MFGAKSRRNSQHDSQSDTSYAQNSMQSGAPQGVQIPREVYETAKAPAVYRRRLILFTILGVGVVVLAVFATVRLYQHNHHGDEAVTLPSSGNSGSSASKNSTQNNANNGSKPSQNSPAQTQQSPQNTSALPKPAGTPATTDVSGSTNNSAVGRPQ